MEAIQLTDSSIKDYSEKDYLRLLIFYVCFYVTTSLILFQFKTHELALKYHIQIDGTVINLIMIAILLFGISQGYLYFTKYRELIYHTLSEKHLINFTWVVILFSFVLLLFDFSEYLKMITKFSLFFFVLSIYLIIRYHSNLAKIEIADINKVNTMKNINAI
jgi:hypothetical protein